MSALSISLSTTAEAAELAALHASVAQRLTADHGHGHWSNCVSERAVLRGISTAKVFTARAGGRIVGTFQLQTKKPWAIDLAYFTAVKKPIYLVSMAVAPAVQRKGIGRALVEFAADHVARWPADGLRLDAYDAPAGAGEFYRKCGMTDRGRATYRGNPLVYFELLLGGVAPPERPAAPRG
jgi:GNAT superfamily N-acetyltransferase